MTTVRGLLIWCLLLFACGGTSDQDATTTLTAAPSSTTAPTSTSSSATTEPAITVDVPDLDLGPLGDHPGIDPDDLPIVGAEGLWLCVTRDATFDSTDDLEAARRGLLARFGVDDAAYADFVTRLADDIDLRQAVELEFTLNC